MIRSEAEGALDRAHKARRVRSLTERIDARLRGRTARSPLKVFSYPLDKTVLDFQWEAFLGERACYPEDYAAFHLMTKLFADRLGTDDPDRADYFFLPLYWPAYECHHIELGDTMNSLQFITRPKQHLLFSPWDTYPRPLRRRANPYCTVDYGRPDGIVMDDYYLKSLGWMDERFTLICYESSIDRLPHDIGMHPTLPLDPASPGGERPFLYSFTGSFSYFDDDHIRGRAARCHWERLRGDPRTDTFVGTLDEAEARFKTPFDYLSFPRTSTFTLCPAGWGRWSFRLAEAILSGSIPVILADYYDLPFAHAIPWSRFSLVLPESSLRRIDSIIRNIAPAKIRWLQAELAKNQRWFTSEGAVAPLVGTLQEYLETAPWNLSGGRQAGVGRSYNGAAPGATPTRKGRHPR